MRKADIRLGVVYAYQQNTYGDPDPAVLVSMDLYTGRGRDDRGPGKPWCQPAGASKPGRDYLGRATGYVVVLPAGSRPGETPEQLHARMLAVTTAELEATTDGHVHAGDGLYFAILTRLTPLAGIYDEVMAERAAKLEREHQLRQEGDAARLAREDRKGAIISRFWALGLTVSRDYRASELLTLSLDEAENIAARLEG